MLSVNRMYHLLDVVSKHLAVSPRELSLDLHNKPVTAHQEEYYSELFTLYNSYHAHLKDVNLNSTRKDIPDENEWGLFCNTFYNWTIGEQDYCFRLEDTKTSIRIGKTYIPAFTFTCLNNNRTFLIAPRVFPYVFVFAKRYERSLDSDVKDIQIRVDSKEMCARVFLVSGTGNAYFTSCFGLSCTVFRKYLAESLHRMKCMSKYKRESTVFDLTLTDSAHKLVSPHFRNGHIRTYKSGKRVYIHPTYVFPHQ